MSIPAARGGFPQTLLADQNLFINFINSLIDQFYPSLIEITAHSYIGADRVSRWFGEKPFQLFFDPGEKFGPEHIQMLWEWVSRPSFAPVSLRSSNYLDTIEFHITRANSTRYANGKNKIPYPIQRALTLDFDIQNEHSRESIVALFAEGKVRLPPTWIIESSQGRFHAWFMFKGSDDHIKFRSAFNLMLGTFGQSDKNMIDLHKNVRIPGTWNHKYIVPHPVLALEHYDTSYTLDSIVTDLGVNPEELVSINDPGAFLPAINAPQYVSVSSAEFYFKDLNGNPITNRKSPEYNQAVARYFVDWPDDCMHQAMISHIMHLAHQGLDKSAIESIINALVVMSPPGKFEKHKLDVFRSIDDAIRKVADYRKKRASFTDEGEFIYSERVIHAKEKQYANFRNCGFEKLPVMWKLISEINDGLKYVSFEMAVFNALYILLRGAGRKLGINYGGTIALHIRLVANTTAGKTISLALPNMIFTRMEEPQFNLNPKLVDYLKQGKFTTINDPRGARAVYENAGENPSIIIARWEYGMEKNVKSGDSAAIEKIVAQGVTSKITDNVSFSTMRDQVSARWNCPVSTIDEVQEDVYLEPMELRKNSAPLLDGKVNRKIDFYIFVDKNPLVMNTNRRDMPSDGLVAAYSKYFQANHILLDGHPEPYGVPPFTMLSRGTIAGFCYESLPQNEFIICTYDDTEKDDDGFTAKAYKLAKEQFYDAKIYEMELIKNSLSHAELVEYNQYVRIVEKAEKISALIARFENVNKGNERTNPITINVIKAVFNFLEVCKTVEISRAEEDDEDADALIKHIGVWLEANLYGDAVRFDTLPTDIKSKFIKNGVFTAAMYSSREIPMPILLHILSKRNIKPLAEKVKRNEGLPTTRAVLDFCIKKTSRELIEIVRYDQITRKVVSIRFNRKFY